MRPIQGSSQVKEFTCDCSQAAATYDLATASGDIFVEKYYVYVATAGATFTSLAIATNDTTAFNLLTSVEGGVANLTAGSNINPANKDKSFKLASGKKIQYTIVGSTGTGSVKVGLVYRPVTGGASIA